MAVGGMVREREKSKTERENGERNEEKKKKFKQKFLPPPARHVEMGNSTCRVPLCPNVKKGRKTKMQTRYVEMGNSICRVLLCLFKTKEENKA